MDFMKWDTIYKINQTKKVCVCVCVCGAVKILWIWFWCHLSSGLGNWSEIHLCEKNIVEAKSLKGQKGQTGKCHVGLNKFTLPFFKQKGSKNFWRYIYRDDILNYQ
jgi:hypothetical protein